MYVSTYDIQTTLDAQLQTVANLPKFYQENSQPAADNVDAFCRSTLSQAKTSVLALGSNPIMNQQGLYQVDCFLPREYGFKQGRQLADSVIAAFPISQLLMQDSVHQLIITSAYSVPGNSVLRASFWMVPVRVEWFINA